ncbi:MAG: hypothetical protein ABIG84_07565 [archaeon]
MKQKIFVVLAILGIILVSGCVQEKPKIIPNNADVSDIINNPQSYDKTTATLSGVVIKNVGAFFGPEYELAVFDTSKSFDMATAKQVALVSKEGSNTDLSRTVSYTFDGRSYTLIEHRTVTLKGTIKYIGEATDSPPFYFEVEQIMENI